MFVKQAADGLIFGGKPGGQKLLNLVYGAIGTGLGDQKSLIVFFSLGICAKPGQGNRLVLQHQQPVAKSRIGRQQNCFQQAVISGQIFLCFGLGELPAFQKGPDAFLKGSL